jgi:alkylhydroperoxidase family enzyme
MPTRVSPAPESAVAADPAAASIIEGMESGWWADPNLARAMARRPQILKALVKLVETTFVECEVEPFILELMRIRTAQTREDQYGAVVRVQLLSDEVEAALMEEVLDDRPRLAVKLAERMALNPHTVDDKFFAELKGEFTEKEIAVLVFAASLFNLASCVSIALHLDTSADGPYGDGLVYRQTRMGR